MIDAPVSGVLLGQVKKLNAELEDLPLSSHAAAVGILTTLLQHRADVERGRQIEEQRRAQIAAQFDPRAAALAVRQQ